MANRYNIKKRYRIRDGVRYIAYRTFITFEEAKIEMMKLRAHHIKAHVYNNHSKRTHIVFVQDQNFYDVE